MVWMAPFDDVRESLVSKRDVVALVPAAVRVGGPGDDRLIGTAAADRLAGQGGDDILRGLAGADELRGGSGADRLAGGRDDDQLLGGRGADTLRGGAGVDLLDGGRGADALIGGGGADVFRIRQLGAVDRVLDFDQTAGDQLDLGSLRASLGLERVVEDFIRLQPVAEGTLVAVDGSGSGAAFVDAALLVDTVVADPQPIGDPIPQPVAPSGIAVELTDYAQAPASSPTGPVALLNQMFHADDGSGRLFVADGRGQILIVEDGRLSPDPLLDLGQVPAIDLVAGPLSGLRGFAFHPDFDQAATRGFGKLYTAMTVAAEDPDLLDAPVFETPHRTTAHLLLSEWTVALDDPSRVDPASHRELLRIALPNGDHGIGQIGFNLEAQPGDPDFGLLYAGIGDGGSSRRGDPFDQGQDPGSLLGTIIRIDPLAAGGDSYSVPADNPFVGEPEALPEIWAFGLRHPQFLSWDQGGSGRMLIADIGEADLEEVNFGIAGANYGWSEREGTFGFEAGGGGGLFELPVFDASFDLTCPVAQYDHDEGDAIAGGFVYRGSQVPELIGQYVFGDIVNGRIFHVAVDDLELGRQAPVQELTLLRAGTPITLLDLVDAPRADLRFGQDESGEIYVTTKQDGMIRTFAPADGSAAGGSMLAGAAASALDALLAGPDPVDG